MLSESEIQALALDYVFKSKDYTEGSSPRIVAFHWIDETKDWHALVDPDEKHGYWSVVIYLDDPLEYLTLKINKYGRILGYRVG